MQRLFFTFILLLLFVLFLRNFTFICSLQKFYVHFSNSEFDFISSSFSVENFNKKKKLWTMQGYSVVVLCSIWFYWLAHFHFMFVIQSDNWPTKRNMKGEKKRENEKPTIVESSCQSYMFFSCFSLVTYWSCSLFAFGSCREQWLH